MGEMKAKDMVLQQQNFVDKSNTPRNCRFRRFTVVLFVGSHRLFKLLDLLRSRDDLASG